MRLAVIPARGGSKRIPRKNIKLFYGKPVIGWSIEVALESECFNQVIVSTDDEAIAEVARDYGAEVPFLRPAELADDQIGTIPVIRHAIDSMVTNGNTPEQVCCIYATAPFIRGEDLQHGLDILVKTGCDYTFSVTSFPFPIERAIRITPNGTVKMLQPEHFNTRSQDIEEAFHDAAQFYWGRTDAWCDATPLFSKTAMPVVLPRHRVQDIDTLEDWERAEWMFKVLKEME